MFRSQKDIFAMDINGYSMDTHEYGPCLAMNEHHWRDVGVM